MTTRRAHPVLKVWHGAMVAALLLSAQPAAAQGTDVCVYLTGSNGKVSGLQMDLSWDPGCMTANTASGNAAQCASAPSVNKSAQTALLGDGSLRVLFLSVSDTKPIPDDTELFCCQFTMVGSQTGSCCSVQTSNVIFAGPTTPTTGGKIGRVYDPSAQLNVSVGGGAPCVTSPAGGSEANPVVPAPGAAVVQPPVVSAPAAPAAPARGGLAPVLPQPTVPAGAPPVQGLAAEAPTAGLAPTEAVPSPVVTPAAAKTPTAAKTAARTPTVPAATPPERTPEVQGTPTQAVTPATAAPATTPTPKHKRKAHKERLD
ncbi:MAG: hypothetical protein ABSA52_21300 [Candidatus Binatia bacterium]|jgi:hypothetical protein